MTILPKPGTQQSLITILIGHYLVEKMAEHRLTKPITWASGSNNPFYVNNRKGVSNPVTRPLIKFGLAETIEDKNAIDYIYGIPTGGIAPATLLALEIGKPILINTQNGYYSLDINELVDFIFEGITDFMMSADVIAGTIPLGCVVGIIIAEMLDKPFLYVRTAPKKHGTEEQVEGQEIEKGSYALLVDPSGPVKQYTQEAKVGLEEERGIHILKLYTPTISLMLKEVNVKNKKIVTTEDLVSTGGSGLNEIGKLIDLGAIVIPRSIFDYQLPEAIANFQKYGLVNKSVFTFRNLMIEYEKTISADETQKIWNWYYDQPNWGDKNGHPRVVKETTG